jgi:tetratricopeptide (TPR) repeat protein
VAASTAAPASAAASVTPPATAAPPASPAVARTAAAPVTRENGFEYKVRADFFEGMRGDVAALDRSIKVCEDTLAAKPNHTEAMVWHGAGMIARSSLAFRAGDRARARPLYQQGLEEMDRAVALDPENIGVRIPRGAVLLGVAPFVPEPEKSRLLTRGTSDYEVALAKQAAMFNQLTLHSREQLLYGLTDAFATLGDRAKAQAYYQRMTTDAAGSDLLARAKARAAGETVGGPVPCEACHAR